MCQGEGEKNNGGQLQVDEVIVIGTTRDASVTLVITTAARKSIGGALMRAVRLRTNSVETKENKGFNGWIVGVRHTDERQQGAGDAPLCRSDKRHFTHARECPAV